ncbi:MAG TPA: LysM peptidoglycan-binding domain-containing protein [Burkholderiales bacterium]|nr:LysM peptidoglycan-binding domain-containing protein [Burkholderiales bacterium]
MPLLLCLALPALAQDQDEMQPPDPAAPGAMPEDEPAAAPTEPAPAPAAQTMPAAPVENVPLQDDVPTRYVVVKGDTLWDISARFLKNPWKWPDVWGINRDHIRNPHLIYPGDVILLDLTGATPRLRLEGVADGGISRWYGYELQRSELRPQMRSEPLGLAIPTISAKAIEPFLIRPLVVDPTQVAAAPMIVANTDQRVIVSAGDTAYVTGLDQRKGPKWQVYRQGRVFQDPDSKEVLGFEAVYLGDADVTGFGEVSTVHIVRAQQEIAKGDRLAIAPPLQNTPYIPRAPERSVRGRVIAGADNTVFEMGTYSVLIMNRGARDGLEVGHVLGLYRSEGSIPMGDNKSMPLPEQRYGLVLVFRVFNKMSYGLVMASRRPVNVLDTVRNP